MSDDGPPVDEAAEKEPAPKKAPAKKSTVKRATSTKAATKKATVKKATAKKATAKAPAEKATLKKAATKKAATTAATDEARAEEPAPDDAPTERSTPTEESEASAVSLTKAGSAAPPTVATAPTQDRRRRPWLAAALVALVVVVVVVAVRVAGGDDDTSASVADGDGSSGAAAVPTPPASAPGQGSFIKSTVATDGSVSVQQWVRSNTPIRSLDVSVFDPEQSGEATARDVVVQALDGTVLAEQDSVGADPVTLKLDTAVPNLYLSYQVSGGAASASQTVEGRMLVTVLGMDVDFSGTAGGVQRLVEGPGTVTNVACLRVSSDEGTAPKPCGAPTDDGGWLVDLRGIDRSDRLLAQLEASSAPSS